MKLGAKQAYPASDLVTTDSLVDRYFDYDVLFWTSVLNRLPRLCLLSDTYLLPLSTTVLIEPLSLLTLLKGTESTLF